MFDKIPLIKKSVFIAALFSKAVVAVALQF